MLLRALAQQDDSEDIDSGLAELRLRLIRELPAVRGKALQLYGDAQLEIARALAAAFPDELDDISAAALTGAFAGAVQGALCALIQHRAGFKDPAAFRGAANEATRKALAPWLTPDQVPETPLRALFW